MEYDVSADDTWIKLICDVCSKKYGAAIEYQISVVKYSAIHWERYWEFYEVHQKCVRYAIDPLLDKIARMYEQDKAFLAAAYAEPWATDITVREKYLTYKNSKVITITQGLTSDEEIEHYKKFFNATVVKIDATKQNRFN